MIQVSARFDVLVAALSALSMLTAFSADRASAETITHFGDFADEFGPVPISYSSATAYDPGKFLPIFHAGVASIPKFDASLGTLTDISVFVAPPVTSPIFYSLGGTMTVTKESDTLPDYGASVSLMAELGLTYKEGPGSMLIFGEPIPLGGGGAGPAGSTFFTTAVAPEGVDGMLTGSSSVLGFVDPADFVGEGFVDTLFLDLIIEDTADFAVGNATATAAFDFDVFDSDSGIDDAVIGVTYTYAPSAVPEPSTLGTLVMFACLLTVRRTRRRN